MLQRTSARGVVRVAERPELVNLILEEVRVDRSGFDAVPFHQAGDLPGALDSVWEVPPHVQRQCRADASQRVHLARVAELLLDGGRRRRLHELAESRPGVGKTPRRQLDA